MSKGCAASLERRPRESPPAGAPFPAIIVDLLAARPSFLLEGAYREVGGDLALGGPAFKAGLGLNF